MSSNSYDYPVYGGMRLLTAPRIAALAAFAVGLIAFLSVVIGGGGGGSHPATTAATAAPKGASATRPVTRASSTAAPTTPVKKATTTPARKARPVPPPAQTPVVVLNGNGAAGAASGTAARLRGYGYPTPVITNAEQMGLPTQIQYVPGYGTAARALERRLGGIVRYVAPLDGIRPSDLHGAKLVLLVGT